jgi:hypothetical protein
MPNYVGGYIRWRPRMVHQSVLKDLKATLQTTGWMAATPLQIMQKPLKISDYFPDDGVYVGVAPEPNTLALDEGTPGKMEEYELGGMFEQPYRFQFSLLAESAAVGRMIMSDLADRYNGLTQADYIDLYNYNAATPVAITRMAVDTFIWAATARAIAPPETHLYLAELVLLDYVDQGAW